MADDSLSILKDAHKAMLDTGFMGDGTARRYRDAFYAEVGRHFPAILEELEALRALVSRARALAKRIGEAEALAREFRDEINSRGLPDWLEPMMCKADAESKADSALQELLAMFGEGK